MRVPSRWCSFALLLACAAGPLHAQQRIDDPAPASFSIAAPWGDAFASLPDSTSPARFAPYAAADLPFFSAAFFTYPNLPDASADGLRLAETGVAWRLAASGLPGRVTVGAWSAQTADLPTFPGGSRPSAVAPYLVLDQTLWRPNPADARDPRALGLFLLYDHPNADLFPTTEHFAAGLSLAAPFPGRPDDLLGVGLSYAHLTSDPAADFSKDAETAFEVFYRFQVTPHLTLRPEIRYVLDPATEDAADAVVASVLLELEY